MPKLPTVTAKQVILVLGNVGFRLSTQPTELQS